jgi:hypothetical protein
MLMAFSWHRLYSWMGGFHAQAAAVQSSGETGWRISFPAFLEFRIGGFESSRSFIKEFRIVNFLADNSVRADKGAFTALIQVAGSQTGISIAILRFSHEQSRSGRGHQPHGGNGQVFTFEDDDLAENILHNSERPQIRWAGV